MLAHTAAASPSPWPPAATRRVSTTNETAAKVLVLWDLDNKKPLGGAATRTANALRAYAQRHGQDIEIDAYGNPHTRLGIRVRTRLNPGPRPDDLAPGTPEPDRRDRFKCPVCGSRSKDEKTLRKHLDVHRREQSKMLNHLAAKKGGSKRESLWRKYSKSLEKYARGAHHGQNPGTREADDAGQGPQGLAGELQRAGVRLTMVKEGKDAADGAIRRRIYEMIEEKYQGGHRTVIVVTDDKEFAPVVNKALLAGVPTCVVGNSKRKGLASLCNPSGFINWQDIHRQVRLPPGPGESDGGREATLSLQKQRETVKKQEREEQKKERKPREMLEKRLSKKKLLLLRKKEDRRILLKRQVEKKQQDKERKTEKARKRWEAKTEEQKETIREMEQRTKINKQEKEEKKAKLKEEQKKLKEEKRGRAMQKREEFLAKMEERRQRRKEEKQRKREGRQRRRVKKEQGIEQRTESRRKEGMKLDENPGRTSN